MDAARKMMGGANDEADVYAALGMPSGHIETMQGGLHLDIWPENWAALDVFSAMQTQWRVGMAGPTGLDYAVLPVVMDLQGIDPAERAECFAGVQEMEREALQIFGRKRANG